MTLEKLEDAIFDLLARFKKEPGGTPLGGTVHTVEPETIYVGLDVRIGL